MSDLERIPVEEEIREELKTSKTEFTQETLEKLAALLKLLDEKCLPRPHLRLKPVRAQSTSVFDSKLGGTPYLPKDMEYPKVLEGRLEGKPLKLLAQLNFEKLPQLEGFPKKGILQFFAGCDDDDVYGIDFDDGFDQNGFRVIYHENITEDITKLMSKEDMPEFDSEENYYPFTGEFLLKAGKCHLSPITVSDYRFDKAVVESYNALFDGDVVGMWADRDGKKGICQADKPLYDAIYEVRAKSGSGLGGYPFFTQYDPRPNNEDYADCDILLFQLDSENGGDGWEDEIMWGDCGVGNFFISAENLAKCDFSKVLYTWDCG
ncbi:MAG: DUF1963 domain-containing protein [Lachnospiraceae bacterium]|nr:DUF1963 domain-containing protein [Lachnospiraceae bacterium]